MISLKSFAILLLYTSFTVIAKENKYKIQKTKSCKEDNGEAEELIAKAIVAGDYKLVSQIIQIYCGEANLALGFDHDQSDASTIEKDEDDFIFPDLVSFKAFAYHSLKTQEYERLANIYLYAVYGDDLSILEQDHKCVCTEEVLEQDAKSKTDLSTVDSSSSMWTFEPSMDNSANLHYNDPVKSECHWSASIKVTCKDVSEFKERKLTNEEIKILKDELIASFSDEKYMASILNDSHFDKAVEPKYLQHRVLMRELLQNRMANSRPAYSWRRCYRCRRRRWCCRG